MITFFLYDKKKKKNIQKNYKIRLRMYTFLLLFNNFLIHVNYLDMIISYTFTQLSLVYHKLLFPLIGQVKCLTFMFSNVILNFKRHLLRNKDNKID